MKKIGYEIYFHKMYIDKYIGGDIARLIKEKIVDTVDIIKYNTKTNDFSLITCKDFNGEREPSIIRSESFSIIANIVEFNSLRNYKEENCPVYHHKHMMVEEDYNGFDLEQSREWSSIWEAKALPGDKKRIGYKKNWKEFLKNVDLI